ncbi:hypothetical protein [Streptomyces phaeochromogenes]
MAGGWAAGVTRARALRTRCLGPEGIREVAGAPSLDAALRHLAATSYRRDLTPDASLAEGQRAVSATLLWHLRVLAGWQPSTGAHAIRLLAADFEISNTEQHLRTLSGPEPTPSSPEPGRVHPPTEPYRLGALATAWPRIARTRSSSDLRMSLANSPWGDPGDDSPSAVATGMRVSAALRTAAAVPEAGRWAAGRLALLIGREVFLVGRRIPEPSARRVARLLGPRSLRAGSFADFRQALPTAASWALDGLGEAADLWRAEARWWDVVDRDGRALLGRSRFTSEPVVGAVAVLSADAWRTRGALELAARGGGSVDWPAEVSDGPG